ncbi:MAG TPA: exostosin family protein [Opitutaceae bacterium]|nr:exostosin family protein [Opitutaceae bacterium]
MKMLPTSCETHAGAWRQHERGLRALWARSSRRHQLVDDPAAADMIVIGNIRRERAYRSLRLHPLVRRFPEKCFGMSEDWLLHPLLRGLYVNAHRGLPFRGRFRTGSYALYHPDFKNPLIEGYVGHAYLAPKRHLASFCGRDCHPVRAALFAQRWQRPDVFIYDTSDFNAFTHNAAGKAPWYEEYLHTMEASKFALCPRGTGAASIRLFEAMRLGVAPVILSDAWIFPRGPDWASFALRVPEREVGRIEALLCEREPDYAELGRRAQAAFRRFFSEDSYFDYVVDQLAAIAREQKVPEAVFWKLRHVHAACLSLHRRLRRRSL